MEILYFAWLASGILSLVAFTKTKDSIIGSHLKALAKANKAEEILVVLFSIVIVCPSVIVLGPITLVRFWVDFD